MHVDAVAPGAHGLDAVVAFAEVELGSLQRLAHLRQAVEQRGAVGHDEPGGAAQHVGSAGRQVELAHPDIDPHQPGAGVEEGIAGQPEAGDVIVRRQLLVGDADVDVPEIDDVAEVLAGAIVLLVGHGVGPSRWRDIRYRDFRCHRRRWRLSGGAKSRAAGLSDGSALHPGRFGGNFDRHARSAWRKEVAP